MLLELLHIMKLILNKLVHFLFLELCQERNNGSLKINKNKVELCVMLEILQIFLVYYQSFYLLLQFV